MWTAETSNGFESDKIAAFTIPYTRGRGLDIGCGMRKVWPNALGIDNGHHFGQHSAGELDGDGSDLKIFADNSLDFIFSSHLLEHFPEEKVPEILAEWARVLKPGGHLVLYVPSANLYPKVGEPGANPDHKWNIFPGDVCKKLLAATTCGWTQVEDEERGDATDNEYSLFEVYKKRQDGVFEHRPWVRSPEGKKRCLVIRYGAIGDQIVASSIFPGLKKKGYHLTYNCSPQAQEIIKLDPHIDEWLLQDKDQVPNIQLGSYWLELRKRYDVIINLCESIEGALLTLPGRLTNDYSHATRHKLLNKNYLEHTHDIADLPYHFAPKFYRSPDEQEWARAARAGYGDGPVVAFSLNGSSQHKVYPYTQVIAAWLLLKTPAHLVLLGDEKDGKLLQEGVLRELRAHTPELPMERVHGMAGVWDIRRAISFAIEADLVVGAETGVLNAVCMEEVEKIVMLSHSSHENLTKHWKNTRALSPDKERTPCFPCHRLHTGWDYCHQVKETAAALCASNITPEHLFGVIAKTLIRQHERQQREVA